MNMRGIGVPVVSVAVLSLALGQANAWAAAKAARGAKGRRAGKSAGTANEASPEEINKLKGEYKWGMSPEEVIARAVERIQASYKDRLAKLSRDPAGQDRVWKQMRADIEKVKKHSLVKFDGQKTGYDVSIIDQEFVHSNLESMLVTKEEGADRYFFFAADRLYKMFVAFDKDMLQGKAFQDFGKLMQGRFGKAKEIYVDEKSKRGATRRLDHYLWGTKIGDGLRLVDRSAFYGVYCLVIYDERVESMQADARKNQIKVEGPDSLVEAVTSGPTTDRDSNDNIIDRITGQTVHKPGEGPAPQDIVVPSPTSSVYAPSPSDVNRPDPGSEPHKPSPPKIPPKAEKGRPAEAAGLEL